MQIIFDQNKCDQYLLDKGVFYSSLECKKCGNIIKQKPARRTFRCTARSCQADCSIRKHTFFFGSRLKSCEILYIAHLWVHKVTIDSTIGLTGHSSATITNFYNHFRILVASTLDYEDQIIRSPGVIVEVDETKLGKRKHHRGHRVEGVWVVAGVERTKERRMFLVPVETRDSNTLKSIINDHVAIGSIIHTDMWKGYQGLTISGEFEHKTVNHSRFFKNPQINVHTNTIEGNNNGLKTRIPARSRVRQRIEEHLLEYIWRRKHEDQNLWDAFVKAIKDIHYDL